MANPPIGSAPVDHKAFVAAATQQLSDIAALSLKSGSGGLSPSQGAELKSKITAWVADVSHSQGPIPDNLMQVAQKAIAKLTQNHCLTASEASHLKQSLFERVAGKSSAHASGAPASALAYGSHTVESGHASATSLASETSSAAKATTAGSPRVADKRTSVSIAPHAAMVAAAANPDITGELFALESGHGLFKFGGGGRAAVAEHVDNAVGGLKDSTEASDKGLEATEHMEKAADGGAGADHVEGSHQAVGDSATASSHHVGSGHQVDTSHGSGHVENAQDSPLSAAASGMAMGLSGLSFLHGAKELGSTLRHWRGNKAKISAAQQSIAKLDTSIAEVDARIKQSTSPSTTRTLENQRDVLMQQRAQAEKQIDTSTAATGDALKSHSRRMVGSGLTFTGSSLAMFATNAAAATAGAVVSGVGLAFSGHLLLKKAEGLRAQEQELRATEGALVKLEGSKDPNIAQLAGLERTEFNKQLKDVTWSATTNRIMGIANYVAGAGSLIATVGALTGPGAVVLGPLGAGIMIAGLAVSSTTMVATGVRWAWKKIRGAVAARQAKNDAIKRGDKPPLSAKEQRLEVGRQLSIKITQEISKGTTHEPGSICQTLADYYGVGVGAIISKPASFMRAYVTKD